mgnify:FL=1
MPSHLSEGKKIRPPGVSDLDIEANDKADELAASAAALCQVPLPVAKNHKYYVRLIKRIQERLTNILLHLPKRTYVKEKLEPKTRVDKQQLVDSSKHKIRIKGNRYHCSICQSSFKAGDPASKYWLQASCPGKTVITVNKPERIHDIVHKGNSSSHGTHELYNLDGLVYCKNCGAYGIEYFINLTNKCEGPTLAGTNLQKCIETGRLPSGIRRVLGTH